MSKNEFNFDFDFGFSAVPTDQVAPADELQKQKDKTDAVINAVLPFLHNLAKNPESEYIHWPNREEKLKQFKQKLLDIAYRD